jgi:hypothetical protein
MAKKTTPNGHNHNHYIQIIFDSCRYDSFTRARPKVIR